MAVLNDPDQLTQGTSSAETIAFTASTGNTTTMTGTGLPAIAAGEFFEIRDHSVSDNNGLYVESGGTPTTSSVTADKVAGPNPSNQASEAVTWLGDSNTLAKNVMFDTARKKILLVKQEGLSNDGATKNAIYSFTKEEWKDDDFLRQFPFPLFAIDLDAGKYQIGTDGSTANGWDYEDVSGEGVNTTKLVRSGGWLSVDANGITKKIYANVTTLGLFEDTANDTAFYQFGTDTTVDDTVDFDFPGPVDEAVLCYDEIGNPDTFTFVDGAGGDDTCTRATGSFITDGFKVGGKMNVRAANTPANDGSYTITGVAALTLTFATGSFNTGEADTSAQIAVDNREAFSVKLRVRDADPNGKTFDQSDLAAIGKTTLNNFIFSFPLSNATDLKISETDANIDANTPYTGMTITYHPTPQSKSGLVGGSFDFGIVINANSGTAIEVYEFVQRQLRKTTDIDNDASTAIGRAMDGLLVFEGDTLVSGDGIPNNPDGGGSGVFIENIAASDQNNLRMVDNTGTRRQFPETISVTLDFNDALINDTVAEYVLYFDRTIRTTVSDLAINAGSPATFDSAGANLPTLDEGAGAYVRISGLTGADAAMNGVYQVTAETSASQWDVVRYDGATIASVAATSTPIDEHPIDSPSAIIVQDDTPADVTGLASSDFNFSFDYDGNTQGGRVVSTDTFVKGRAIGLTGAQFIQSDVQTIQSGTPLVIPLSASNELNYVT